MNPMLALQNNAEREKESEGEKKENKPNDIDVFCVSYSLRFVHTESQRL